MKKYDKDGDHRKLKKILWKRKFNKYLKKAALLDDVGLVTNELFKLFKELERK